MFSGHDYTILGTVSVLRLLDRFRLPMSYGCYVLLEFWDSSPSSNSTHDGPVIVVKMNPTPFKTVEGHVSDDVCDTHEFTLGELSLQEINLFLAEIRAGLAQLPVKPLTNDCDKTVDMLS